MKSLLVGSRRAWPEVRPSGNASEPQERLHWRWHKSERLKVFRSSPTSELTKAGYNFTNWPRRRLRRIKHAATELLKFVPPNRSVAHNPSQVATPNGFGVDRR